jgi:hypothetical protein
MMPAPRPRCTPHDPTVACDERRSAVRRGVFWYSDAAVGWLWSVSVTFPDRWTSCPWCGGTLPTLVDAARRIVEQADGEGPE